MKIKWISCLILVLSGTFVLAEPPIQVENPAAPPSSDSDDDVIIIEEEEEEYEDEDVISILK